MTDRELKAARRHLMNSDPVLRRVIKQVGVYRIRYREDKFGALVEAIIAQQVSVSAARAILKRLLDLYPNAPSPALVLGTPEARLRSVGLSRQKVTYLYELARHVSEGTVVLDALGDADDQQILKILTRVKGIGRWTVEMFLIFCLRRPDVLPVYDLGFRKAVMQAYELTAPPDAGAIEVLACPWRPYRSVGTCYLWASLENEPW